jgi:hypothetical protein
VRCAQGENRHEEQGSEEVASRLVARLNLDGAQWGDVLVTDAPGVDDVVRDAANPTRTLPVQVTRAVGGRDRRELHRQGRAAREVSRPDDAADELRVFIDTA